MGLSHNAIRGLRLGCNLDQERARFRLPRWKQLSTDHMYGKLTPADDHVIIPIVIFSLNPPCSLFQLIYVSMNIHKFEYRGKQCNEVLSHRIVNN